MLWKVNYITLQNWIIGENFCIPLQSLGNLAGANLIIRINPINPMYINPINPMYINPINPMYLRTFIRRKRKETIENGRDEKTERQTESEMESK